LVLLELATEAICGEGGLAVFDQDWHHEELY
jgi:hypothetical protein